MTLISRKPTVQILQFFSIILTLSLRLTDVKSIRVTVYSENYFEGDSLKKTIYTCQNIPKHFNNKTKSVKILANPNSEEASTCAVLYEHSCCEGRSYEVSDEAAALLDLDGQVSSLSPCDEYTKAGPPTTVTLVEHWDNHDDVTDTLFEANEFVAVYIDDHVRRQGLTMTMTWPVKLLTLAWTYVTKNYGQFGMGTTGKLIAVLHNGNGPEIPVKTESLSHPSIPIHVHTYLNCDAEFRNMIHAFSGSRFNDSWAQDPEDVLLPRSRHALDVIFYNLAAIVETSNNGVFSSPAQGIWSSEHWFSIFAYDVFLNVGLKGEAKRLLDKKKTDNMFHEWFFHIYEKYGGGPVLSKFFQLLAQHFPLSPFLSGDKYDRQMNLGEYLHFWSGAAGVNLKEQAKVVFHWSKNIAIEFEKAKHDFNEIQYKG